MTAPINDVPVKMETIQVERADGQKRCHVVLLFYVALLSTVGVALLIGIGYVTFTSPGGATQQVKPEGSSGHKKVYSITADGEEESVEVDTSHNTEVVHSKTADGRSTVMVLDFDRSIAGIYSAGDDRCLLIGGIDSRLPTPTELADQPEYDPSASMNSTTEIGYEIADDYPVLDHTLLPVELRDSCQGKDVFWLKLSDTNKDDRDKRACYYLRVCYRRLICNSSYCYYYYYCVYYIRCV